MSEASNNKQKIDGRELFRLVFFGACVCLILVLMYISGSTTIKTYELGDSDCYMRLVRVRELYNTGNWYDAVISRSNAPYGERLHWTRSFDVLLLAGAVPLSLFTDFTQNCKIKPQICRNVLSMIMRRKLLLFKLFHKWVLDE